MENNSEQLSQMRDLLESIEFSFDNSQLIQDNKIIFKVEEELYRCRMPSQKEKNDAENQRNLLYVKLISQEGHRTRKQIKTLLKINGIDVDILEAEKMKIQNEIKNTYLELASKLSSQVEEIERLKSKVTELQSKHIDYSIEITNYMAASVEDQLEKEYVQYLAYMLTEKLDRSIKEETWVQVWPTYKDFEADSGKITAKALENLMYLLVNLNS